MPTTLDGFFLKNAESQFPYETIDNIRSLVMSGFDVFLIVRFFFGCEKQLH